MIEPPSTKAITLDALAYVTALRNGMNYQATYPQHLAPSLAAMLAACVDSVAAAEDLSGDVAWGRWCLAWMREFAP